MTIPKASHLVERAAEHLLRSGALEDSAAQLLGGTGGEAAEHSAGHDATEGTSALLGAAQAPLATVKVQRSSLFAAPSRPTVTAIMAALSAKRDVKDNKSWLPRAPAKNRAKWCQTIFHCAARARGISSYCSWWHLSCFTRCSTRSCSALARLAV